MPMHRRNKAPATRADSVRERWFCANRIRQHKRFKLARLARRVTRHR